MYRNNLLFYKNLLDGKPSLLRFDLNGKLNEMKKKYYKFLRRVEDWDNNLPTFQKKLSIQPVCTMQIKLINYQCPSIFCIVFRKTVELYDMIITISTIEVMNISFLYCRKFLSTKINKSKYIHGNLKFMRKYLNLCKHAFKMSQRYQNL